MCDPLTISGIVLSAAGAGANYLGQQQVQSARDDALAAERIRQQALDQEAAALNTQSQDRYQNFEGQQQEKRVFGDGRVVDAGREQKRDAKLRARGDVDPVDEAFRVLAGYFGCVGGV